MTAEAEKHGSLARPFSSRSSAFYENKLTETEQDAVLRHRSPELELQRPW